MAWWEWTPGKGCCRLEMEHIIVLEKTVCLSKLISPSLLYEIRVRLRVLGLISAAFWQELRSMNLLILLYRNSKDSNILNSWGKFALSYYHVWIDKFFLQEKNYLFWHCATEKTPTFSMKLFATSNSHSILTNKNY